MYLRLGAPIFTVRGAQVSEEKWVETVRRKTKGLREQILGDLLELRSVDSYRLLKLRAEDPWRQLNPLAWGRASQPPESD